MGIIFGKQPEKMYEVYAGCLNHLQSLDIASRAIVEGLTSQQNVVDMMTRQFQEADCGQVSGTHQSCAIKPRDLCTSLYSNQRCCVLQACNIVSTVDKLKEVLGTDIQPFLTTNQAAEIMKCRQKLIRNDDCFSQSKEFGRMSDSHKQELLTAFKNDGDKQQGVRSRDFKQQDSKKLMLEEMESLTKQSEIIHDKISKRSGPRITLEELHMELNQRGLSVKSLQMESKRLKQRSERKIGELQTDIRELESKIYRLQNSVTKVEHTINGLQQQVPPPRAKVKVQVYSPPRGDIMITVSNEFTNCLQSHCLTTIGPDLDLSVCEHISQVQSGVPTLVLCIHASRLGLDVQTALAGVERSVKIAAIVFHHKAVHALPNQSSDRVLTAPEYTQLGGIFDMAFLSGQGLYSCDMNNRALSEIYNFIMTQSNDSSS